MNLRQAQIRLFTKFAHLYDSGVPLADALELLREELPDPLREAITAVIGDLYGGSSLADAMARRAEFGKEVIGIIRAGEQRGELGAAAKSAADGLGERVIDPRKIEDVDLDAVLATAGDARVMHVEPDGRLRLRTRDGLFEAGVVEADGFQRALAQHAGIDGDDGRGAFLHGDRLLRVVVTPTAAGPATVVRLSGRPAPEPPEARAWREGRPGLLLVVPDRYADVDACLRGIVDAWPDEGCKKVAVDLPAPGVLCVETVADAMEQDPDVLCVAELDVVPDRAPCHVVAVVRGAEPYAGLPHRVLRLRA